MDTRLQKGIELFNSSQYHLAHDVLEELWRDLADSDSNKKLIQGIIQLSVGFYLVEQGRTAGAEKMFERSKKSLLGNEINNLQIDVRSILSDLELIINNRRININIKS